MLSVPNVNYMKYVIFVKLLYEHFFHFIEMIYIKNL